MTDTIYSYIVLYGYLMVKTSFAWYLSIHGVTFIEPHM